MDNLQDNMTYFKTLSENPVTLYITMRYDNILFRHSDCVIYSKRRKRLGNVFLERE